MHSWVLPKGPGSPRGAQGDARIFGRVGRGTDCDRPSQPPKGPAADGGQVAVSVPLPLDGVRVVDRTGVWAGRSPQSCWLDVQARGLCQPRALEEGPGTSAYPAPVYDLPASAGGIRRLPVAMGQDDGYVYRELPGVSD